MKTVVYLAGRITGREDTYREEFKRWARRERACRRVVLNPAELPEGMPYESYMPICMAMIQAADRVLVLPGSEGSRGVAAEVAFARCIGKPVEYAEEDT